MKKLLGAIKKNAHPHAGDMMRLALYTAMRRGEMFKLTWEDIDFQRNFIRLREPKGDDDQTIPMNEFARQHLLNRPRFKAAVLFGQFVNISVEILKKSRTTVLFCWGEIACNGKPYFFQQKRD
jgi:integrase